MTNRTTFTRASATGNLQSLVTNYNANLDALEVELENSLSRKDNILPNSMEDELDMNGNDIINVNEIGVSALTINGTPVQPFAGVTVASAFQSYTFTATLGQTSFSVAPYTAYVASVQVEVNGLSLPPSDISVSGTNVIIPACTAGDEVVIRRYTSSPSPFPSADDITYTPAGTINTRSVQNKLREIVNAKDFGAALDGVTNDIEAFEAARDYLKSVGGGTIRFNGFAALSRGLLIDAGYIHIEGDASSFGDGSGGTGFRALSGFTGDFIIKFAQNSGNTEIRSCGFENVGIEGGPTSDAHGLVVSSGYDAVSFQNINITGIGDGRNCFLFDAPLGKVGQTIFGENLFGIHRNATNTAPAIKMIRQQEFTLINCKAWAGSRTADYDVNTGTPIEIESCNGGTLISCSTVATKGTGIRLVAGDLGLSGITLVGTTVESVSSPIEIDTDAVETFGTMSRTVSVGTEVRQPADGTTAKGTAYLSTLAGVYAHDLTGTFSPGNLYDADGVLIGTIASVRKVVPDRIKMVNTLVKGVLSIDGPQTSYIRAGRNLDIDWLTGNNSFDYPLVIDRDVEATVLVGSLNTVTNHAVTTTRVQSFGASDVIRSAAYYAEYGVQAFTIPPPRLGRRLTIVHDAPNSTAAQADAILGSGISLLLNSQSLTGTLRLPGSGSSISLYGISSTQWVIENVQGGFSIDSIGYFGAGGEQVLALTSSSLSIGVQTHKRTYSNSGRAASLSTVNLVGATDAFIGLEYTFLKVDSGDIRIVPNGTDQILGGTGAGKYVSVAASGSLTIKCVGAGKWAITSAYGTPTWEP